MFRTDSSRMFEMNKILLSIYLDSKHIPILEYLINLDSYQAFSCSNLRY